MLSASNFTGLSLPVLDDFLNQTYYSSPDTELPLLDIEDLNQTISTAVIANATEINKNSTIIVEGNMTADDSLAGVGSKVLQIDVLDLFSFIRSSGPFDRSTLVQAIDSLLPSVFASLGVAINATTIPSGSAFFRLLDNVTAQLTDFDFDLLLDETLFNDTVFGNGTYFDSSFLNGTMLGDFDFFNSSFFNETMLDNFNFFNDTMLGNNFTLNGTAIGEIPGYFDQLNATGSEQLSNAIAITATIILRETLSEVPVSSLPSVSRTVVESKTHTYFVFF